MAGFTKLFNSILDSTIWQEPHETRLLWITMLAMCDARGEVQSSIPGLAKRAGITLEECESGLLTLSGPDRYSRTKDHEGRRIAQIDGGWRLLNHGRYRELLSAEERREYNRKKQAEWRATRKNPVNDMSMTVNHNKQCQHITEAEAEAEADIENRPKVNKNGASASLFDLKAYAQEIGVPESDGEFMFDHWESNGWRNGANKVKCWKAGFRKWKASGWLPSQKQQHNGKRTQTFAGIQEDIPLV